MFIGILVFLVGMCIGSFLNVCIYRIPQEKSVVSPPSSCPGCGEKLKAIDLIPVLSFILLKGKCRNCNARISLQYPLVELLTGILWLFVYMRYGLTIETLALLYLFSVLIPVAFIDLAHFIIPNGLVLAGLLGGIPLYFYHLTVRPVVFYRSDNWYAPLLGMVSASGILFIVALIGLLIYGNDGAMGMGDVKIFLPIGLFLGWKLALVTLLLSIFIAGIVCIFLLLFRIVERKSTIPFGPFIVLGTIIVGLFNDLLFRYY